MKTQSQLQMFRHGEKVTAVSTADPSLTLLVKDHLPALVLAETAHQASYSSALFLETVSFVCAASQWSCRKIPEAALVERDGFWFAEDTTCGETIAARSRQPFVVVFISKEDYERLQIFKNQQAMGPIFEFALRLFKTLPALPRVLRTPVPPLQAASARPRTRVLVVDDERSFTKLVKLSLEETGRYEVRVENWPEDALTAVREFRPDLVLLDIIMPRIPGGNVSAAILKDPDLKDTPVVYLTTAVRKHEVEEHQGINLSKIFGELMMLVEQDLCDRPRLAKSARVEEIIAAIERYARKRPD